MSRLIVKNLPPYVTPARLQQHFEQKGSPAGTLTDVKVAFKNDGTSRRFGFVGYKTNEEALTAKEWFDKTFVDSSKISVNIVEGVKDAPKPRPNKRPRIDNTSVEDVPVKSTTKVLGSMAKSEKSKKDSQLDEFLEVMQTKKGPSWANGVSPEASTSATKLDDSPLLAEDEPPVEEGLSDMEWMRRRMTETTHTAEQDIKISVRDANSVREAIFQTSRLFVRNLAFSCSDTDLTTLFGKFGELSQVHIPVDPSTRQPKGLAYVTFAKAADAVTAYEVLDKTSFQGRIVHILPAVDRKGKFEVKEGEGAKRSVKDENNAQRKATAKKEFNWSMLYMNSDAVASSIADRMNISKADILNPDSDDPSSSTNPAVKLALAETHIINETKAYLESNGVVLASFSSSRTARADTTILVKNIPYGMSDTQIRELFEPHGTVSRVLVPPAGTIVVVQFEKPDEVSRGFRAVAYRRLGNSQTAEATNEGDEAPSLAAGTTLFVKNLAFSTTTERLNQMFRNLPSFAFARVEMKRDRNRSDGKLSVGYGFIGFKDVDGARKTMKSMQGFVLDGHALHIKFAGRGADEDVDKGKDGVSSKSRTTKMLVKNVPFEATKKDIRDLFGSHGQLKSVRLPKKFDSRTRGFAFLDFVSRQEAENAYAALRHTHLLGRHLVLEWAEEAEQDLEMLRKKAGVGFGAGKEMPGKKRKLDMSITGENEEEDEEE
ncbi:hypothetical protein EV359DRAFT_73647 [Lentinula novae-zelandiae]|nr:hypothetical protein EV359DRAFT_73647 [Lentinula novae-zelandiae]